MRDLIRVFGPRPCIDRDVTAEAEEPLFEPDPEFATGWHIDEPLAQGALRFASVTILEHLRDAGDEAASPRPDLGDLGPLGVFPPGVRSAMTPLLIHKLTVAATVMGWKLFQPGEAIRPMCVAEEFVLELIRREAIFALDLVDADRGSASATRGVYEVCEDDDILAVFEMEEPADAALALGDPVNQMMGKVDMRLQNWFEPFFGDPKGILHPLYFESERTPAASGEVALSLEVVDPGRPLKLEPIR